MNLIGLWVNLSRAYEIALLGNFTIQVVFDKEYTAGFDDYAKIKDFYNDIEFESKGDLVVDIWKPKHDSRVTYESIQNVRDRVEAAKSNLKPKAALSESSQLLLKTATERLGLSVSQRESIVKVAQVIAQLDAKKSIGAEHLAESIQYKIVGDYDAICNAENKSVCFGEGIEISTHALDPSDVKAAIEYLQSL